MNEYLERYQGYYNSIADEVIDASVFEDIDQSDDDITEEDEDSCQPWDDWILVKEPSR